MKQKVLLVVAMLLAMTASVKGEELSVADVALPQDGTVAIEIKLLNPNTVYDSFSFDLELPQGVVPVMATEGANNGYPSFQVGTRFTGTVFSGYKAATNVASFARLTDGTTVTGTEGLLIAPIVKVEGVVPDGTVLTARLTNIKFTKTDFTRDVLAPVTFNITVGEVTDTRTILDEESVVAPENATGVDVLVKRTIWADEWSTICLPFSMNESQLNSAFGNDVELANFSNWTSERDSEDKVVKIYLYFANAHTIEANHPYLIKVSSDMTEFTVDNVDIEVAPEPVVQVEFGNKLGKMIGNYLAGVMVPTNDLFLNNNMFWYSKGLTAIKAFRAYFELDDVLSNVESAGSRICINFEDETTKVGRINLQSTGNIYSLDGRKVQTPRKGLYLKDGKKMVVK